MRSTLPPLISDTLVTGLVQDIAVGTVTSVTSWRKEYCSDQQVTCEHCPLGQGIGIVPYTHDQVRLLINHACRSLVTLTRDGA